MPLAIHIPVITTKRILDVTGKKQDLFTPSVFKRRLSAYNENDI